MHIDTARAARDQAATGPDVLIIDDHPMVGEALGLAIELAAPAARIRTVESFHDAQAALSRTDADLILLDLDLGGGGDWSPLLTLRRERPATPVAIVSATRTGDVMQRARALGAAGYLKKSAELVELGQAVAALLSGDTVFPEDATPAAAASADSDAMARLASLTPTQARVLDGLRRGLLNKQIAYELDISISTTKAHMTAIFRKLGVQNRTQALLTARSLDIAEAQPACAADAAVEVDTLGSDPGARDHSAALRGA